jgi:two-component system nitrogen regulation response regulator NtrX
VDEFVEEFSRKHGHPAKSFDAQVIAAFRTYSWPGNVRELKNMVERLMILSRSERILPEDLMPPIGPLPSRSTPDTHPLRLREAKDAFERTFILDRLKEFDGNISKTAEVIGLERSYLHRKIKELDIPVPKDPSKG